MNDDPLIVKLEQGIIALLRAQCQGTGDALAAYTLYAGHDGGVKDESGLNYLVVTAHQPGGDLQHAGVYDVQVQFLLVTQRVQPAADPATATPAAHHAALLQLTDLFSLAAMDAVIELLNAEDAPVTGYGVSAFDPGALEEGRDARRLGHSFSVAFTAHLTE